MASTDVAIVGMAAYLPGAATLDRFWRNLAGGVESITWFGDDELAAAGVPAALRGSPDYVPCAAILDDADRFDAAFFDVSPAEAALIDPQQRRFLECAYHALEDAGGPIADRGGRTGVWAGSDLPSYLLHVLSARRFRDPGELFRLMLANDKDFVATRVAYKLDLRGPALGVQTACSTSLVAVHLACQSLLGGECDRAIAGAVAIAVPQVAGSLYEPGSIQSPDGHCRPFDARAAGTVGGSGVGAVVLRRLDDALADRDPIRAVIKGSAIGNDGAGKVGFTAPSVAGQARVVREALAVAAIDPGEIDFIEAHGTATPLGDPIEVAALREVFGGPGGRPIALGAVKSNLGHLGAAAGMAGLVKAVLALQHRAIPPTLWFERGNPDAAIEQTRLRVVRALEPWPATDRPRRAGVSSFGLGGTNAHVVLEEAPPAAPVEPAIGPHLIVLSADTAALLAEARRELAAALAAAPALEVADVARTLQVGRPACRVRWTAVCADRAALAAALDRPAAEAVAAGAPAIAWAFGGQGASYRGLGAGLYRRVAGFRDELDRIGAHVLPRLGRPAAAGAMLDLDVDDPAQAQPALFGFGYALARLWQRAGLAPAVVAGHSLGELIAACVAGVFAPEDAAALVVIRGRLAARMAPGAMLAVAADEAALAPWLGGAIALAAVNAPARCVLSGPPDELARVQAALTARAIASRPLATSRAYHGPACDPILDEWEAAVAACSPRPPSIPMVSSVSGGPLDAAVATTPEHWRRSLRAPVRWDRAAGALLAGGALVLEIGPGRALGDAARAVARRRALDPRAVLAWAGPSEPAAEPGAVLAAAGALWERGVAVDWLALDEPGPSRRRRVSLPGHRFHRLRHWIDGPGILAAGEGLDARGAGAPAPIAAVDRPPLEPRGDGGDGGDGGPLASLTALAAEQLGIDPAAIDPHASFLELGFDSLALVQLGRVLADRLGVRVPFRELLDTTPTLALLSGRVAAAIAARASDAAPPPPTGASDAAPPPPTGASDAAPPPPIRVSDGAVPPIRASDGGAPDHAAPAGEPLRRDRGRPAVAALTDRQGDYLERLIARYTARTAGSKRAAEAQRRRHADNRTSARFRARWKELVYPISGARADGCALWDVDGNRYVDLAMGFGVHLFGHRAGFIDDAVRAAIDRGFALGPQSDRAPAIAEAIAAMTGVERVAFLNTGSEAVMTAIRLARTVTGRRRIAVFAGAYHGSADVVLAVAAPGASRPGPGFGRAEPAVPGVPAAIAADVLVLPYGSPEALATLAQHAGELAAVLVEPVQSRRPALQPRAFLHELRRLTRDGGAALVFDEIITGFRCDPGGAQAWFDVRADLVTYGKVIGGGLPIGVVAGAARFLDPIDGGPWQFGDASAPSVDQTFFAGTFCKHPLAMAATAAVITRLRDEGPALPRALSARTAAMAAELEGRFAADGVPIRVPHFASLFGFGFEAGSEFADLFSYALVDRGYYLWEGGTCFLSTAHGDGELAGFVDAAAAVGRELAAAGFFDGERAARAAAGAPPAREALPVTDGQAQLYHLAQLGGGAAAALHQTALVRLRGRLDRAALAAALTALVARHEALRARFTVDGAEVVQRIAPPAPLDLPVSAPADRASATAALAAAAAAPFDLATGPLVRARLAALGDDDHLLAIVLHHLVTDSYSFGVLMDELGPLYAAARDGTPAALPPPSSYAEAVRAATTPPPALAAAAQAYWTARLVDPPPPLELPGRAPALPRRHAGGRVDRSWGPGPTAAVRRLGVGVGCTPFMTLLAGYALLLRGLVGRDDLIIGVHAAGQLGLGAERLVGDWVDLLPLRVAIDGTRPVAALFGAIREHLTGGFAHQRGRLGALTRALSGRRDPRLVAPLPVAFNLERVGRPLALDGLTVEGEMAASGHAMRDLSLNVVESPAALTLEWTYDVDRFDPVTIGGWADRLARILEALADRPDASPDAIAAAVAAVEHRDREAASEALDRELDALSGAWAGAGGARDP